MWLFLLFAVCSLEAEIIFYKIKLSVTIYFDGPSSLLFHSKHSTLERWVFPGEFG